MSIIELIVATLFILVTFFPFILAAILAIVGRYVLMRFISKDRLS